MTSLHRDNNLCHWEVAQSGKVSMPLMLSQVSDLQVRTERKHYTDEVKCEVSPEP